MSSKGAIGLADACLRSITFPASPKGGGSLLGPWYARALDLAARLDVRLAPARSRTEPIQGEVALSIRVETARPDDWAQSRWNEFPQQQRDLPPWEVYFTQLSRLNPLVNLADWCDERFVAHDVPVHTLL